MIEPSDPPAAPAAGRPLLELEGIEKRFGGVLALAGVDFTLHEGEIHALVGENGAGKSTLMKIIAGVHTDYGGRMVLDGRQVRFRSARDALDRGIGMVHQELCTAPDLTVAENVFLGNQPTGRFGRIDWRRMNRESREQLARLGLDLDPRMRLGDLPIGLQQLVELARVLFSGARIVILDEPTSALSPPEIERLFAVLKRLKSEGRSFVFISHFLDDVLAIADSVTVFRNGELVETAAAASIDKTWIIERMIGRGHHELEETYTGSIRLPRAPSAPPVLQVEGLSVAGAFQDVSFSLAEGEILGIYGFMGCGQLELARTLFGKLRPDAGSIKVDGSARRFRNTADAAAAGIAFVPESRRSMLFGEQPVYRNMTIAILEKIDRLWLRPRREIEIAGRHVTDLGVRPADPLARLGALSGGNQQKVALGKWLTELPRVLVMSEPTRGMDVGAKEDVVRIVTGLREKGVAIIVVSTEPETVLSMATRVLVMRKGRMVHRFADEAIAKDDLLAAA
ncbi:MAG: sugar ABC transporter ATP-binding protein [Geminicoccaceae bacterium]|nr:sugar ABC transporter ATP-binding protein [Geminicoccaceae bacterium]